MIQRIAYAAGGIDIPSLPEEIQVALNQVLAGEIELTDFISQMNQFQFSGVYTKFAPEDVVPEHRERVSKPLWSRNIGTLDGKTKLYKGFYTSSVQSASNAAYYIDVYNASPNLVDQYGPLVQSYPYLETDRDNYVDAESQFAIAFGQFDGHGSKSTEATDNSATKAIYSQYRNILLDPLDKKFTFDSTKVGGGDTDNIYVINVNRARYREKLDPGNWEIRLAKPSVYLGKGKLGGAPHTFEWYSTSSAYHDTVGGTAMNAANNPHLRTKLTASLHFVSSSANGRIEHVIKVTSESLQRGAGDGNGHDALATEKPFLTTTQPSFVNDGDTSQSFSDSNDGFDVYRHFGHEGLFREFADDSKAQESHRIKAGQRVFNIVSGSIESEADLGSADFVFAPTSSNAYGLFYPDIGVFCFNGDALTQSFDQGGISLPRNIGAAYYDVDGGNDIIFFDAMKAGYKFQARSEETVTSTHYFCRVKNKQYNFSNNPTFYTASDGSFTNDDFFKNPRSYITTVGLYNDANELLAVAKLSKPLLKSFDREAVIKVKLDF